MLEYNSITWSPHLKQDIMMIQKKFKDVSPKDFVVTETSVTQTV